MKNTVPPPLVTLVCALLIYLSKPIFPELIFNYSNKSVYFLIFVVYNSNIFSNI